MTVPNGFTRKDAERIATFVRTREARRALPGYKPRERPKRFDMRLMVCTSEPNVEAIDNFGNWPETINAKVLSKAEGYTLDELEGRCDELGDGGGGGGGGGECPCDPVSPCSKSSRVRFVWGGNASLFGATEGATAATLSYVFSDFASGCEEWVYRSDDGTWEARLGPKYRGGDVVCDIGCYGIAQVTWSSPPANSPLALWYMKAFVGNLVTGEGFCQFLCSQGVYFDNVPALGEPASVLRMYWEGGIGSSLSQSFTDTPAEEENEDDGEHVVQLHRFMNGIPFYGEVFTAINFGGRFYAWGPHHSGIAGNLTARPSPRTVTMDRCDYEVPFIYTIDDPNAAEGTRHLLAWNAARKKYVMVAMGDCQ